MIEQLINYLSGLPKEVVIIILSLAPISEARGAIPVAITVYKFSVWKSFIVAVIGNFLFVIPFLWFLNNLNERFMKLKWYNKFFTWWSNRVMTKSKSIEELEFWGLVFFVGIPLPVTGAWSGCLAGFLLRMKFYRVVLACLIGIVIAATVVTIATVGIRGIAGLL